MKGTRQPFTSSNLMGTDDGFGSRLTVVFFDFFFPLDFFDFLVVVVVEGRKRLSSHSDGSFNSPPK